MLNVNNLYWANIVANISPTSLTILRQYRANIVCYLGYEVLYLGNNKQNVPLALALLNETTITASKSYYPNQKDASNFLTIFKTWWTIANSKQRFSLISGLFHLHLPSQLKLHQHL